MAYDGTLKFDTKIDTAGMQKDGAKLSGIVKGLSVFEILKKGADMVAESFGDAVSRVDTLERFPKVLTQMGHSAEAAAASTQKLSDGVQGLPTTLDSVVSTAQRITVLTGNLENATDTTLALNNAFLASQATVSDAERGLTQYVQMLSKGTVDIVSWRTLQETMGYALQQTAEAFGYAGSAAQNELYGALRDGVVAFDQFNGKMIELNEGVGGFAELAQTASGGIATSWTNVKTAVVKGVADVINAVDDGAESLGGIAGVMDDTKGVVTSAFKVISSGAETVAEHFDDLLIVVTGVGVAFAAYKGIQTWTSVAERAAKAADASRKSNVALTIATQKQTQEQLKATIQEAKQVAAMAHTEAAQKRRVATQLQEVATEQVAQAAKVGGVAAEEAKRRAVDASVAASNANVVATLAETAAENADTAATVANKAAVDNQNVSVGLGTALVGMMTGVMTADTVATAAATAAKNAYSAALTSLPLIGVIAGLAAIATATLLYAKSVYDNDAALQENRRDLEAVKAAHDSLKNSLKETESAYREAAGGAEVEAAANEKLLANIAAVSQKEALNAGQKALLQSYTQKLEESVEGLTLAFDEEGRATLESVEAAKQKIALQKEQRLAQAAQEQYVNALQAEAEIQATLNNIETSRQKIQEQHDLGLITEMERRAALNALLSEEKDLRVLLEGAVFDLDVAGQNAAVATEAAIEAEEKQKDVLGELADQYGLTADEIEADMERLNLTTQEWTEMQDEAMDSASKAIRDFAIEYGGSYAEIEAAVARSGLTAEEWVAKQEDAFQRAKEALDAYVTDATQLYERIETESNQTIETVTGNLNANAAAVEQYAQDLLTLDGKIDAALFATLQEQGPEKAAATARMLASASEEALTDFDDAYKAAAEAGLNAYETVFGKADTTASGENVAESTAEGIADSDAVKSAAEQMIASAKTAASNAVTTSDFPSVGKNISLGMAQGIRDGIPEVEAAATELAQAAEVESKKTLDERSPSRLFRNEIGLMVSRGFALGIEDGIPEAEQAALDLANSVYRKATEAVSEQKYYGKLTLKEELAVYKQLIVQFKDYADIRKELSREIYRVEQELRDEAAQKAQDAYRKDKDLIDAKTKHQNLSLQQQLKEWERVQKKYKKGTEERIAAEKAALEVQQEIYDEAIALEEKYQSAVESRAQAIMKAYSLFEKIPEAEEVTGEELLSNLQGQVDATKTWAADLAELQRRGIDEGLLEELRSMGPKASDEISALLRLTSEQLTQYSNLYGEKQRIANEQAMKELENLRQQTDQKIAELLGVTTEQLRSLSEVAGRESVNGIADGINSRKPYLMKQVKNLGKQMVAAIKKELKINSPSRVFRDSIGAMLPAGLVQGIASGTKNVVRAVVDQMKAAREAAEEIPLPQLTTQSPLMKQFLSLSDETIHRYAQQFYAASMANQAAMARSPAFAAAAATGGTVVNNHFEQTINSDRYMSPADNSRAAEAFLRRERHRIK